MDSKMLSKYILPLDQPVVYLDCVDAFNGLTDKEKLYTYYMSKASWYGSLIITLQTSPESPAIFCFLHDMFKSNGIDGLKSIAVGECDFSEDDWKALLIYATGVFSGLGNYKGFGDTKIIPGIPVEKLESLVAKAKFNGFEGKSGEIWEEISRKIYSLPVRERQLGMGVKGVNTYFSANCNEDDAERISRFMKQEKIAAWNTRCFKTVEGEKISYEIRTASVKTDDKQPDAVSFEDCDIRLTKGDYSPLMTNVWVNLAKAKNFAANENEKNMLEGYMDSFMTGCVEAHRNGTRSWIKNKGPAVETYIGFIENYRDPAGVRAEFEGFVCVVNKALTEKFTVLVENAEKLLELLPWPKEFEMDVFLKPDFTALDAVTYGSCWLWEGINIPNYDDIRQNEGFKNMVLTNIMIHSMFMDTNAPFLNEKDAHLYNKYGIAAYEVKMSLHELLGHGSGKSFTKGADGKTNYRADLKNPVTNEVVEGAYEEGETFWSLFGSIGCAYEECRSDCVRVLLTLDKTVLKIFGFEGEEADTLIYVGWLSMVFNGAAKALEFYEPKTQEWKQAHARGFFAILQVLLEAGEGLVTVVEKEGSDGKPDLLITLDQTKIETVGRKAIANFLLKLQVYKSTANVKAGTEMFEKYSKVDDNGKYPWLSWREIVLDKARPHRIFVQPNLSIDFTGPVQLKGYDASPEGVVQSWIERFSESTMTWRA